MAPSSTPPPAYRSKFVYGVFSFEELIIFILYPVTICLGSLVSLVSQPDNYFSSKRNVFNQVFVKNGWFWTTIAYMLNGIRLRISSPTKMLVRYLIATLWWFVFTQWFFGAPIMDRVFIRTGGMCFADGPGSVDLVEERPTHDTWTSLGCRHMNGAWEGGHDVSGHSFLLTHSSLFLWYEILPVIVERGPLLRQYNSKLVFALLALWWWMLLMTGIYFHTFKEKKVTGWLCGIVSWIFVYVAAPRVKALKKVIGVPGI
ncbi:inositol phospholipid synthesis and fat-storage-inducing TM-domain-containing protein [Lipomyces arxii]|uniref:inositol phospholipid synthesis and fat-storage-inducing TM-domain-containing protein n=1 Tax=Lipomyces arxii TaxID=56418 RepID=UPI0034CF5DCA